MFFVSLDLGQAGDPSAITINELVSEPVRSGGGHIDGFIQYHHIRYASRFPLNTPYPKIVRETIRMMDTAPLKGDCTLVVDATGVGRPVVDMFTVERVPLIPVIITAGVSENFNEETGYWNVPKRVLVSSLQILFGEGRLKFADTLELKETITKELLNFKIKVTSKGNDTYEAWRDGDHDDLVLSLAMGAWFASRFRPKIKTEKRLHSFQTMRGF